MAIAKHTHPSFWKSLVEGHLFTAVLFASLGGLLLVTPGCAQRVPPPARLCSTSTPASRWSSAPTRARGRRKHREWDSPEFQLWSRRRGRPDS